MPLGVYVAQKTTLLTVLSR